MFTLPFEISPDDVVSGYNHVHHATTLRFLETARLAYLEEIGQPNERLISEGLFLVITRIDIQYSRELFSGLVEITCENPKILRKKIIVDQNVINSIGKLAVSARVESMMMSGETKRAVIPGQSFIESFVSH